MEIKLAQGEEEIARLEGVCGVTLDATGTLIHAPRLGEIYAEIYSRHGIEVDPAEVPRRVRTVWRELDCLASPDRDRFATHPGGSRGWWARFVERFCEHLGAPAPGPFLAAELFARFACADAWELYPEAARVVEERARRGLALAVVSNWDERLPGLLAELGLARHLDAVSVSAEVGVEKPHPGIFDHARRRLGVPAEAILHVGDKRLHDLEGAIGAGFQAVLLDRSGGEGIASLEPLLAL